MMLFACDLDRTLIYSARFLDQLSSGKSQGVCSVEKKDGREISFMTEQAWGMLSRLNNEIMFVPATARTVEQYCRTRLGGGELEPDYAVLCNGGTILVNGEQDMDWQQLVQQRIEHECLPMAAVLERFSRLKFQKQAPAQRQVGNLFFYQVIERDCLDWEELADFSQWLAEQQWQAVIQYRKMYVVPNCLTKWEALNYLIKLVGEQPVVAAGDSLLDLSMLEQADLAIIPRHGEVKELIEQQSSRPGPVKVTEATGIQAGEEILAIVSRLAQNLAG